MKGRIHNSSKNAYANNTFVPLLKARSKKTLPTLFSSNERKQKLCKKMEQPWLIKLIKYYCQHIIQDALDLIFRTYSTEPGKICHLMAGCPQHAQVVYTNTSVHLLSASTENINKSIRTLLLRMWIITLIQNQWNNSKLKFKLQLH